MLPTHDKLLSLDAARTWRDELRVNGRRLVFTNGCYDLVHPGHIGFLTAARALGDALLVALNTDASVRRNKGPSRPINPEVERAEVMAALRMVDAVILFDDDTPADIIAALLPDVLVKGEDWAADAVVGRDTVEAHGGSVVRLPIASGYSTSRIIEIVRDGGGPLGAAS